MVNPIRLVVQGNLRRGKKKDHPDQRLTAETKVMTYR